MRYIKILTLVFVVFSSVPDSLIGQRMIVFEDKEKVEFHFSYIDTIHKDQMPNLIIRKLARITAPTRDPFFGFGFIENRQLLKESNTKYRIRLIVDSATLYNNLSFKGYQLNKLTFPDQVRITYALTDRNTGKVIKGESLKEFVVDHLTKSLKYRTLLDTIVFDSLGNSSLFISQIGHEFFYSHEKTRLIDSVLASIIALEELKPNLEKHRAKIKQLNDVKVEAVGIYNIDLRTIEKEMINLNPKNRISQSLIDEIGQEGIIALYDSLNNAVSGLRIKFDRMVSNPEYEYFSDGYHAYQKRNYDQAASLFHKSIRKKNEFPPPYYFLAEMAYQQQLYDSSIHIIIHIMNDLEPDYSIQRQSLQLGELIYEKLVLLSEKALRDKDLNNAIANLDMAIHLCNTCNGLACSNKATEMQSEAKQQMLDSWASVGLQALENNKLPLAISYLGWSESFYTQNEGQISSTLYLDSLKIKLLKKAIRKSEQLYHSGKLPEALYYLNYSDSLRQANQNLGETSVKKQEELRHNILNVLNTRSKAEISSASIQTEITENNEQLVTEEVIKIQIDEFNTKYENLIKIGIAEYKEGNPVNAFLYLKNAKEIENSNLIMKNDTLNKYFKLAAKHVILKDIEDGKLKAWGYHMQVVETIINLSKADAEFAGLQNDTEVQNAIQDLERLVFENKCQKFSTNYISDMQTASHSRKIGNYREAVKYWQRAYETSKQNQKCNLDSVAPRNMIEKYERPANYQKKLAEATELIQLGKDSIAFKMSIELEKLFDSDSLQTFGISSLNPAKIAQENQNNVVIQLLYLNYIIDHQQFKKLLPQIQAVLKFDPSHYNNELMMKAIEQLAKYECANKITGSAFYRSKSLFGKNLKYRWQYLKNFKEK